MRICVHFFLYKTPILKLYRNVIRTPNKKLKKKTFSHKRIFLCLNGKRHDVQGVILIIRKKIKLSTYLENRYR